MVIVGGSGSMNGFDSAAISKKYGDEYVIINLGTNANISAAIYYEYLSSVLDKDDIILWAPEAGEYVLGYTNMHIRAWEFQSGHYDIFRSVDISKYTKVFSSFASYARAHKLWRSRLTHLCFRLPIIKFRITTNTATQQSREVIRKNHTRANTAIRLKGVWRDSERARMTIWRRSLRK